MEAMDPRLLLDDLLLQLSRLRLESNRSARPVVLIFCRAIPRLSRGLGTPKQHLIGGLHLPIVGIPRRMDNLAPHVPNQGDVEPVVRSTRRTLTFLKGHVLLGEFSAPRPRLPHLAGEPFWRLPQQRVIDTVAAAYPGASDRESALRLAAKGRGTTSPNPMVGAIVVNRGRVVGQGYHLRPGLPVGAGSRQDVVAEPGGVLGQGCLRRLRGRRDARA